MPKHVLTQEPDADVNNKGLLQEFAEEFEPFENSDQLLELIDAKTNAHYCECHIKGSKIVSLGTTDVPLDPDDQSEYRANREIVVNDAAYQTMIADAKKGRSFSNIVAEYTKEFDPNYPLKIIGGQHRVDAIRAALDEGVDEYHGIKVYLNLDMAQRLDVQLISNTNIAVSRDLVDRLQETYTGPHLRDWCQSVGLLAPGEDFADSYERGGPISVKMARTFITNYFEGLRIDAQQFDVTDTTPTVCPSGGNDPEWEKLKAANPRLWSDPELIQAAKEFSLLVDAQRKAFQSDTKPKPKRDYPEKALNIAVMAAWAYTAGLLRGNPVRLKKHYALRTTSGRDPLNAAALAKGRHKTDPANYRGLGARTDPQERGRFVELFYLQAEEGKGITKPVIDIAIKGYHVKRGRIDLIKTKAKQQEA